MYKLRQEEDVERELDIKEIYDNRTLLLKQGNNGI